MLSVTCDIMLHTAWRNIGKSQVQILVPYLSNDASSPWIIQSGTFSQAKHRGAYFSGIIWSIQDPKGFVSWPRLTSLTVMTLLLWMQVPLDIMAKKMEAAKRRRQNTPNIIRSRAWERTWKILLNDFCEQEAAPSTAPVLLLPYVHPLLDSSPAPGSRRLLSPRPLALRSDRGRKQRGPGSCDKKTCKRVCPLNISNGREHRTYSQSKS